MMFKKANAKFYYFIIFIITIVSAFIFTNNASNASEIVQIQTNLISIHNMLSSNTQAKEILQILDVVRKISNSSSFKNSFLGNYIDFRKNLEKARVKILWNDYKDAQIIVGHLLSQVGSPIYSTKFQSNDEYNQNKKETPQTPIGNGTSAAIMFGATLLAGLGAIILLFFTGQVSHR